MSDSRRFDVVGKFFARQFPERSLRIGDVAGGAAGFMRCVLGNLGYEHVITIDPVAMGVPWRDCVRRMFDATLIAKLKLDALIALHPDGATDHVVTCGLPAVVVPCCVLPSAVPLAQQLDEQGWLRHLQRLASERCAVTTRLDMQGQNVALVLKNKKARR